LHRVSQKGARYGQEKQGNTRRFWRRFQGFVACATDKGFILCEKAFEVTEGEEGFVGGGGRKMKEVNDQSRKQSSQVVTESVPVAGVQQNDDETLIRKTWEKIVKDAIESVHRPDEKGIVHSPSPKTWEEAEKDAIELAKIEYPREWEQYERLSKN
jgi:hypothetical protein